MAESRNTILQGDCLKILPTIPPGSVDFILTDPPYIARYTSRDGRSVPNDDNDKWLKPAFAQMYRALAPDSYAVCFYGWPNADRFLSAWRAAGFRVVGHFVFPKRYTSAEKFVRYQHECAYLLAKGDPKIPAHTIGDVIDWAYSGNKLHPTQKPICVLLPLVETFSKPGGLVLDPFARQRKHVARGPDARTRLPGHRARPEISRHRRAAPPPEPAPAIAGVSARPASSSRRSCHPCRAPARASRQPLQPRLLQIRVAVFILPIRALTN